MQILNQQQIDHKIKRLAIEILEHNLDAKKIVFLGINNNGHGFAKLLLKAMPKNQNTNIELGRIRLNPASPLNSEVFIEGIEIDELEGNNVIIVDDVANTGRTLFYALKPLLKVLPKKVQIAVLVDRQHKSYPIIADYVGLSLATTLKDNIEVQIIEGKKMAVFLK